MDAQRTSPKQPEPAGPAADLRQVPAAAAGDAGGLDPALLGDFLVRLAAPARDLDRQQRAGFEALGARAVEQGISLRELVDLYLSAAWRAWPLLPAVGAGDADTVRAAGTAVLHVVDDAVAALAEGYTAARRAIIRREESLRREFVDDLLSGTADPASLLTRADSYGLHLAGPHLVLLALAAEPYREATPVLSEVTAAITGVESLVVTRDGALVVVLPGLAAADRDRVTAAVSRVLTSARLAVGRTFPGPGGVARSFVDAREALTLARRLGRDDPVVLAERLVVFQVLLRDRQALLDLIDSVLAPLQVARGGARPLLDTVHAFCDLGGNTTRTADKLHLSPRAVTYRLARVAELTGWDPADPEQRYVLHTAVLGARAIGWPDGK